MQKKTGTPMIVAGAIFAVIGLIVLIIGISINSNAVLQFASAVSGKGFNPGTIFIIIGSILLGLGAILLIAGVLKSKKSNA